MNDQVVYGQLLEAEDARSHPTDHGVGRRCEECGAKVSRWTPPLPCTNPPEIRCNQHWNVPDGVALSIRPGGGLEYVTNTHHLEKAAKSRRRNAALDGPPCECHGEPTRIERSTGKRICRVLARERSARYAARMREPAVELDGEELAA